MTPLPASPPLGLRERKKIKLRRERPARGAPAVRRAGLRKNNGRADRRARRRSRRRRSTATSRPRRTSYWTTTMTRSSSRSSRAGIRRSRCWRRSAPRSRPSSTRSRPVTRKHSRDGSSARRYLRCGPARAAEMRKNVELFIGLFAARSGRLGRRLPAARHHSGLRRRAVRGGTVLVRDRRSSASGPAGGRRHHPHRAAHRGPL